MPARTELAELRDFTGGVNYRADPFQLAPNESPDLLNMDVDPRGGVRVRKSFQPWNSSKNATPIHSMGQYHSAAGSHYVVVQVGTGLGYATSGAWTLVAAQTNSNRTAMTQFGNLMYGCNGGVDKPFKFDGAVLTRLNQAWNDVLGTSTSGNMPYAKKMATFAGHLFIACTTEGGTDFPSRIRWSHPNQPEDWRQLDYIDVDPGFGGPIVNILPFGDQLLIFKERATYVLTGYGWESWTLSPVSHEHGCVAPDACAATPTGAYFFTWPGGVYRWNGRSLDWVFERIEPAMTSGLIPVGRRGEVTMAWLNNRLWVACPWSSVQGRIFIMDPSLGRQGAWTAYDLLAGPMMQFANASDSVALVTSAFNNKPLLKADQPGDTDDFKWDNGGNVVAPTSIVGTYKTPWLYGPTTSNKKRWRRFHGSLWGGGTGFVNVSVYRDFDTTNAYRQFDLSPPASTSTGLWGQNWGSMVWGNAGEVELTLTRGPNLGTAKAVQLLFSGASEPNRWGLDSITIPYAQKPVR